ncbi:MAG: protein kinase domain-containing protein [Planctomycetaceae bacterium]
MHPLLKEIVNDALELPAAKRRDFLTRACSGDAALLQEAEAMLEEHAALGDFLEPIKFSEGLLVRAVNEAVAARRGAGTEAVDLVGAVLDQRYQLEEQIGAGASGAVYDATDLLTGEHVAVKLFLRTRHDPGWMRREVSALRLLDLPGVVRLLDDGVHEGLPYVVMRKVAGAPFPGHPAPVSWESLAPTAIALFETLARIHAHGVFHGDLKPANVLVDSHGGPTILDLGVSSGPALAGSARSGIAGTPAYLAPEQLLGGAADSRSDLYAAGVMMYEALTSRNPHPAQSLDDLVSLRLSGTHTPLSELCPQDRPGPFELLESLLALEPGARPASAAEVAAAIAGEHRPIEFLQNHPLLSFDGTVDALVAGIARGGCIDLHGPPRAGTSACLARLAERLRGRGHRVRHLSGSAEEQPDENVEFVLLDEGAQPPDALPPGAGVVRVTRRSTANSISIPKIPEASLRGLFGGPDRLFHLREDAARELHRRTHGWPGRILAELAAWLRAGIARIRDGAVVIERSALDLLSNGLRVCAPPPAVRRRAGPGPGGEGAADDGVDRRLLGLLEVAAPGLPEEVLGAAARCEPSELKRRLRRLMTAGRVELGPEGLVESVHGTGIPGAWTREELRSAHGALAASLGGDAPGRARHILCSAEGGRLAEDARAASLRLMREGRVGRARILATEGLAAARHEGRASEEVGILEALAQIAAAEGTERALQLALYEIGRCDGRTERRDRIEMLTRVALLALRRDGARALALAEVLGRFEELGLERLRQAARVMASRCGRGDREEEVLSDLEAWAEAEDGPGARGLLMEARGWQRYLEGRFEEAIECQTRAFELADSQRTRLSALLNLTEASLEYGDLEATRRHGRNALTLAATCRHAHYEARAEYLLRASAYRGAEARAVDFELVDSVAGLRVPNLEAQILLNEAAVAWRSGDDGTARQLAGACLALWRELGNVAGSLLANAFGIAVGLPCTVLERAQLLQAARHCRLPGIGIQSLGLLARRGTPVPEDRAAARAHAAAIPQRHHRTRRELASVEECLTWLTP